MDQIFLIRGIFCNLYRVNTLKDPPYETSITKVFDTSVRMIKDE